MPALRRDTCRLPAAPARPAAVLAAFAALLLTLAGALWAAPGARAAGASVIAGTMFHDANGDGVRESGESGWSGQMLYLLDSAGTQLAYTTTDANGHYAFTGLADGSYTVELDASAWWSIRDAVAPTTTPTLQPKLAVSLAGSATANFGFKPIVRSSDAAAPISTYTGTNGLRVNSYDNVVSAQAIYADLMSGSLIGPEAGAITIDFDLEPSTYTSVGVAGVQGAWSGYQATSYVAYDSWLDGGDQAMFHEYGIAWGMYYADIVQQDSTLAAYLKARGLYGNPSLGSSQPWQPIELIGEDYRELFGSPNAKLEPQENGAIPTPEQVAGLQTFLATTFRQAPVPTDSTPPSVSGTPAVGQTLTCGTGVWTGSPAYTYAWTRDGAALASATAPSYTVAATDAGHALACTVTATNSAGSAQAGSPSVSVPVPAAPAISSLAMSPNPVKTSGTATFTLSAPATVTETILSSNGGLVATLLSGVPERAGTVSTIWSRPRSVKSGAYKLTVTAVDAYGQRTTASTTFSTT